VKFLVDNQLPAALARWLVSRGHEAMHVLDVELTQAKDEYVSAKSLVLITKDEDFSWRATAIAARTSVVWVRMGNCRRAVLLAAFEALLPQIIGGLEGGARLVEIR
jgi:predicted nuclease of predicted toxin-antitoxin system